WGGQTSLGELIVAICTEPIPRLEVVASWVPLDLARLVHRGLERDPAERPQSMPDFIRQLEIFSGGSDRVNKNQLTGPREEQRSALTLRISMTESAAERAAEVHKAALKDKASAAPKPNPDRMATKLIGPTPEKTVERRRSKPPAKSGTLGLVGVAVLS